MMDNYTNETKNWLDQRFKQTDSEGIYLAHQPIYGFRQGHCEPDIVVRYIITYHIMKMLSHLQFNSLLDVGGAEGYKAALVRSVFNASVRSVDLSEEACNRAKEIYGVDGEAVDIHKLPYEDNEFDVVLCSETLEHVSDIETATRELIRVCKKAVIITVPHESKKVVEHNIKHNIPHAHIHSLDVDSFNFAMPAVSNIISKRFHNPVMKMLAILADATERKEINYPRFVLNIYNFFVPVFRKIFGNRSIAALIKLDALIANTIPSYSGMVFVLLKDGSCYSVNPKEQISVQQIMEFKVPYYYVK